ncbi:MAG: exonuclease SbcCD subunit D [Anaerolineae bacterium]|nr:exonuclease SbcCD subunit D [Anaerolineae bacterium]
MTIQLLHFADLHIGVEPYGQLDPASGINRRVLDYIQRLDELIDYGLEHQADLVLFAGDVYQTASPNPTHQRAFARCIKRLADAGIPVVLLLGDHDLPGSAQKASSVDIFDVLAVPRVIVGKRAGVHRVESRHGPLQVATLPYPTPQRLLAADDQRRLPAEEKNQAVEQAIVAQLQALAGQLDPQLPAVLAAHLLVAGAVPGSEQTMTASLQATVPLSALTGPGWDYVALGHVHRHQDLNPDGYPPIVYPGGLERMSFEEEEEAKGFCRVSLARRETTWRFVAVAARPFVTVQADLRAAVDPVLALRQEIDRRGVKEAVVRLVLQLRADQEQHVRDPEVRALLAEAAFVASIRRETAPRDGVRLDNLAPEALTPHQLLQRYLETQDVAAEYRQELLSHAKEMLDEPTDN